jgi:tetratricopeptide (TPR) repeat protein
MSASGPASRVRSFRPLARWTPLCVLALAGAAAWASDPAAVQQMLREGRTADALLAVDQGLKARPQDLPWRFLRGVVLTEQNKLAEAEAQFLQLVAERPDLPEVYNNLAVVYSRQDQYEKARQALEMSVRLQPRNALAHENLGDVYAKLAAQSYARALDQQPGNTGLPMKLALVRELFSPLPRPR